MNSDPHDHGTDGRDGCFPAGRNPTPVMEEEDNFAELQKEVEYLRNLCGQLELRNKLLTMNLNETSKD